MRKIADIPATLCYVGQMSYNIGLFVENLSKNDRFFKLKEENRVANKLNIKCQKEKITELMCALATDLNEVKKLVEQGCDLFHRDINKRTVLDYCFSNPDEKLKREIAHYIVGEMSKQYRQMKKHYPYFAYMIDF